MKTFGLRIALSLCLALSLPLGMAKDRPKDVTTGQPGRIVRIELQGRAALTIAEVEVMSGGKNVAKNGKTTQSSTAFNGSSQRAIDGNKNPDYGKNGITHTSNVGDDPWWEVDLGDEHKIDSIQIWNRREPFAIRLNNFKIVVLDSEGSPVFLRENVQAPDGSIRFDLQQKGKVTYLDHNGKPGVKAAPEGKTGVNRGKRRPK